MIYFSIFAVILFSLGMSARLFAARKGKLKDETMSKMRDFLLPLSLASCGLFLGIMVMKKRLCSLPEAKIKHGDTKSIVEVLGC